MALNVRLEYLSLTRDSHRPGLQLLPVKVVSERLGHPNPAFTIDNYRHVLPGLQSEAAHIFEDHINPSRDSETMVVGF